MTSVAILDTCKPGEYSETGLFPCTPCEKSTYQNASSSRSCIECPRDMTTAFEGSIDALNCSRKTETKQLTLSLLFDYYEIDYFLFENIHPLK